MGQKQTPSPWQSVPAGGAAGGLESLRTYPTEYLKTRQQLQATSTGKLLSPGRFLVQTIREHGPAHMYTGSGAFCVSNAAKSGVRFFAFEPARRWLPTDQSGKRTAWGNMGAGMIAGTAERVLVVTPGEILKTKIIDDQAGAKRYTSAAHAIRSVGIVPVTLKQSANAIVRFTTYNFFVGNLRAALGPESSVLEAIVFAGALAGVVTVYATMPFDTFETGLQALDRHQRYTGPMHCLRSITREEGIAVLWRGTPLISGAISFSIYESVLKWTNSLGSPEVHTANL
ncbi:mitochondrial carrier domain-containing protein [Aspergillus stella-maris]|uniref:mitochondrial carrier domain-containing protein n=1 Tax=Aspergillus stella-maris TaxID=1810926 RepID=UPI003CCDFC95